MSVSGDPVAGLEDPPGDAGELSAGADALRQTAHALGRVGGSLACGAQVAGWSGGASVRYHGAVAGVGTIAAAAEHRLAHAAHALERFAHELRAAKREVQRARGDAKDASKRMLLAQARARQAATEERLARARADQAAARLARSTALGLPDPVSQGVHGSSSAQASIAQSDAASANAEASRAAEDLDRARRRGHRAKERLTLDGQVAAAALFAVAADAPRVRIVPAPPKPHHEGGGGGWLHGLLGGLSAIPGLGTLASGVDGVVYAAEGDWTGVALSVGGAVPFAGEGADAAKLARVGEKYAKDLQEARAAGDAAKVATLLRKVGHTDLDPAELARRAGLSDEQAADGWKALAGARPSQALNRRMKHMFGDKPTGWAAHHIVAARDPESRRAQRILYRLGVNPNEAANGVYLPASMHTAIHASGRDYYTSVAHRLEEASDADEARAILAKIREDIVNGRRP